MQCQHADCRRTLLIDCIRRVDWGQSPVNLLGEGRYEVRYYCLYHSQVNGFCWHCGSDLYLAPGLDGGLLGLCDSCLESYEE